jgi:hypothetical protein
MTSTASSQVAPLSAERSFCRWKLSADLRVARPRQNRFALGIGALAIEHDVGILQ